MNGGRTIRRRILVAVNPDSGLSKLELNSRKGIFVELYNLAFCLVESKL